MGMALAFVSAASILELQMEAVFQRLETPVDRRHCRETGQGAGELQC
jgi:hypothetical protein